MTLRKYKEYFAAMLCIALLVSCISVYGAEQKYNDPTEYVNTDEFNFVRALDLMPICNYDDFQPDNYVTRAEFARILCAITDAQLGETSCEFVDTADSMYKDYIAEAYQRGYVSGYDKYVFKPNANITADELIKCMINVLGYDNAAKAKGGYPKGYINVAGSLDLLSGVRALGGAYITRGDICRVLFNMRKINMCKIESIGKSITFSSEDDSTFLSDYLNIGIKKGIVTDNGISALRNESKVSSAKMSIGDEIFVMGNKSLARKLLGRYVEAYYSCEKSVDEYEIKYIQLDKTRQRDETEFPIKSFEQLSGRKIKYLDLDKRARSIELTPTANIIFNNKAVKVLTSEMFDYDYGTVTYVPAHGENDDTLIIEGFVSWYVNAVDREMETLRTTEASPKIDGKYTVKIPNADIGKKIIIENEYGLPATINDITLYSVIDISKNEDVVHILIAPLGAEDKKITSFEKDSDDTFIIFEEKSKYKVSDFYKTTNDFLSINKGDICFVYLNNFGEVVNLITEDNSSLKVGYLIKTYMGEKLSSKPQLKLLAIDNTIITVEAEDKINWSDEKNTTGKKTFASVYNKLKSYEGPINYKLNSKGKVSDIYLPVDIGVQRNKGRLGIIFDGDPGYNTDGMKNFGTDILSDKDVKTFAVFESEADEKDRYRCDSIQNVGFKDDSELTAYNYEPNSLFADFLEFHSAATEQNAKVDSGGKLVAIQKIKNVTVNGQDYVSLKGYNFASFTEIEYIIEEDKFDKVRDTTENNIEYTLKNGDIVLCSTKGGNANEIENIRLLWRSDMDNIVYPDTGRRGGVAGNIGYYDPNNSQASNPFIMYGGGNAIAYKTAQNACWTGYVYYVDSKGGLNVTTKDLSCGDMEDDWDDEKYRNVAFIPHNGRYGFLNIDGKDIICREGTVSDIRTYLMDKNNASRVLVIMNYARADRIIIINGEMK